MKFELTDEQVPKINDWHYAHQCRSRKRSLLTYRFTPTGIGSVITVKCSCGKKIDVTDVTKW